MPAPRAPEAPTPTIAAPMSPGASSSSAVERVTSAYVAEFRLLLDAIDHEHVAAVVNALRGACDSRATVFIAGNGGSAATASHWVNDLGKATKAPGRPHFRVACLSDNVSWLTALANDEGYDRVFAGQLENFGQPGDIFIVISASGNSPNLLRGVDTAQQLGMTTVGLLGFDGGALKNRVDHLLWLPTAVGAYGLVETGHSLLADLVTACLINDRRTDPAPR